MTATRPDHPPVKIVDQEMVPILLKKYDRWLCWNWVWKEDRNKYDKPPLDPRTGKCASSTDPSTWCSFAEAHAAQVSGKYHGIGFALGEAAPGINFSGFDLDDCIVDGKIRPDAIYLGQLLHSYAELSPSWEGVKVFCLGKLPVGRRSESDRHFEIYDSGRYFTVTGHHLDDWPREVLDCQGQLTSLYSRLFSESPPSNNGHKKLSDLEIARSALAGISSSLASDYASWLQVGMALKSVSEDLLQAWDNWSQLCPDKYAAGACQEKWGGFRKSGLSIGSLIYWARQNGWELPYLNGNGRTHRQDNGQVLRLHDPLDPHMGDGLTEEDGAGPWEMVIEMGHPKRFLLKSPIWQASPDLRDGYVVLSEKDIFSWSIIRVRAAIQAPGFYVRPDCSKPRVWDGVDGRRLFRHLFQNARKIEPGTDYDRILSAAEFILEKVRSVNILPEANRDKVTPLGLHYLEDGTLLFKLGALFETSRRTRPEINFDDLREAAAKYGKEYCPRIGGRRVRYHSFSTEQARLLDSLILQRSTGEVPEPRPAEPP